MTAPDYQMVTLEDPAILLFSLIEGNPGAAVVGALILKHGDTIDPDSWSGSLGALLQLQRLNIRGPKIWMLYKDVCGQNIEKTLALLRAVQLGIMSETELNHAITHHGTYLGLPINTDLVLERVKAQLIGWRSP